MAFRRATRKGWLAALSSLAVLCLALSRAQAQQHGFPSGPCLPSTPVPSFTPVPAPAPAPAPKEAEKAKSEPTRPDTGTQPAEVSPNMGQAPSFAEESGGATAGDTTSLASASLVGEAGYITSAIPVTMFRLRFDTAYGDNRPDRAEFFYAKCGCAPDGPGPKNLESNVNFQDLRGYFELALGERLSGFIDVPYRSVQMEQNPSHSGLGDIEAGFKVAMLYSTDTVLSFQLKTYLPTGDAVLGLGTDHVSLEPSLLLYQRLSDRLLLEGQVGDWIPLGGTDFAGNIVNYGLALSYKLLDNCKLRVIPVGELLGWTVLSGQEFTFPQGVAISAVGDTIVNAKVGVRIGFGDLLNPGWISKSDLYVGYGRALTGDVWYRDIFRVEYRLRF
jgi:hypothetical protein